MLFIVIINKQKPAVYSNNSLIFVQINIFKKGRKACLLNLQLAYRYGE